MKDHKNADDRFAEGVLDSLNGRSRRTRDYYYVAGYADAIVDPWFYLP